jgi:hypothetical protein
MNKFRVIFGFFLIIFLSNCAIVNKIIKTAPSVDNEIYYKRANSGREINLVVMPPEGIELENKDEYLLDMIQLSINETFKKYSAITVVIIEPKMIPKNQPFTDGDMPEEVSHSVEDAVSVEKPVTAKPPKPVETNNDGEDSVITGEDSGFPDYSDLFIKKIVNCTLKSSLSAVSQRKYNLVIAITDDETGEVKAEYTVKQLTIPDIKSGAITKAALSLLENLGVVLTENGILLAETEIQSNADVQVSIARSRSEIRNNNTIAGLANAYAAIEKNPLHSTANEQIKTAAESISTSSLGWEIKNDYQQQQRWLMQLKEFERYYRDYHPFELFYTPPQKKGETNYSAGTVDFEIFLGLQPAADYKIMLNVLKDIIKDLNKTKNRKVWGFLEWPVKFADYDLFIMRKFTVQLGLYNDKDEEVKKITADLYTQLQCKGETVSFDASQKNPFIFKDVYVSDLSGEMQVRVISINNGIIELKLQEAVEDNFWVVTEVEQNKFPREKTPTISKKNSKVPQVQTTLQPLKQAPKPKSTSSLGEPELQKRIGVSVNALMNPSAFKTTSLGFSVDGGFDALSAELVFNWPLKNDVYNKPDSASDFVFGIGGGIGYTYVSHYFLPSLLIGVTYNNLPGDEKVVAPYGHLKIDILPWRRYAGLRLGFLAEMGSTNWGESYERYFKWAMNKSSKTRINGKLTAGFVFWY